MFVDFFHVFQFKFSCFPEKGKVCFSYFSFRMIIFFILICIFHVFQLRFSCLSIHKKKENHVFKFFILKKEKNRVFIFHYFWIYHFNKSRKNCAIDRVTGAWSALTCGEGNTCTMWFGGIVDQLLSLLYMNRRMTFFLYELKKRENLIWNMKIQIFFFFLSFCWKNLKWKVTHICKYDFILLWAMRVSFILITTSRVTANVSSSELIFR